MNEEIPIKYFGKRRSLIRRIGSFLPLKPAPKVYVSVTPLHSMTSSMINEDTSSDFNSFNGIGAGSNGLSQNKPDLLEPISFGSEVRLLALEQELQDLREQISTIVKTGKPISASQPSLTNGSSNHSHSVYPLPPPPPPPLPPPSIHHHQPSTPHIARRASLQDHVIEDKKKPPLTEILKDIDKVKLKPIARSPGGRPVRSKRENSPCNDLQEILRRRFIAMQASPVSPDSTMHSSNSLNLDDSF